MFKIYIANLGKYNEGELIGQWLTLPATEEEIQNTFIKIGIAELVNGEFKMGKTEVENGYTYVYEEYAIHDYEVNFEGIEINEYSNINALNELAEKLESIEEYEQQQLMALLEGGYIDKKDIMENEINDILDNHVFVEVDEDLYNKDIALGYALADLNCIEEKLGDLAGYFDYEKYGRDARFNGAYIADNGIAIL